MAAERRAVGGGARTSSMSTLRILGIDDNDFSGNQVGLHDSPTSTHRLKRGLCSINLNQVVPNKITFD